jgi:hypothetical protein
LGSILLLLLPPPEVTDTGVPAHEEQQGVEAWVVETCVEGLLLLAEVEGDGGGIANAQAGGRVDEIISERTEDPLSLELLKSMLSPKLKGVSKFDTGGRLTTSEKAEHEGEFKEASRPSGNGIGLLNIVDGEGMLRRVDGDEMSADSDNGDTEVDVNVENVGGGGQSVFAWEEVRVLAAVAEEETGREEDVDA